jgi:hypothetical protein
MLDYELFKPIRNFGLFLSFIGGLGFVVHFALITDPEYTIGFQVFIILVSFFHFISGINIVTRNRWGFRNLKFYLYMLYPGFPLGYFFAKRTLKYIEAHNIEQYFKKSIKI